MKRLSMLLMLIAPLGAFAQSSVFQASIGEKAGITIPANSPVNTPATKKGEAELAYQPMSCQQILSDGKSQGDGFYTLYTNGGEESAYCDMTMHGGGWQLVVSIAKNSQPRYLRWQTDYPANVEAVISPENPQTAYMYKGSLARFSQAREGVSCTSKANCKMAFGSNLAQGDLNTIRSLMGSTAREAIPYSQIPSCTTSYNNFTQGINDVAKCTPYGSSGTTITGWQVDIYGTPFCWAMRSNSYRGHLQGSSLCQNSGDPNGTRHALLWMR